MKTPEKSKSKAKESKEKPKRLVLLDAHAILHRAYHALPDFFSQKGEPTGALYGLSTMILKIIQDLKPDYLIGCYDLPQKTYRHEAYDQYKAGRKKSDPELVSQMIRSRDVFGAFNIPIYDMPGFEADDMLGTIVELTKDNKDLNVVIASGDMDTLQLVNKKKVQVYTLKKGIKDTIIYDEDAVMERFGFGPKLLPDFKGLRGDPSDNIIGISGIGEKTATILIQKFGTIENMYKVLKKNPAEVKASGVTDRILELLKDGEEEATFSKMLATIRRDAPIDFKLPEVEWKESIDMEKAEGLFRDLDFRTLGLKLKEVLSANGSKNFPKIEEGSAGENGEVIDERKLKEAKVAVSVIDSNISDPKKEDIYHFGKSNEFETAFKNLKDEIKAKNIENVYYDIELPLIPILEKMEAHGVKIDVKYLKDLSKKYHKELQRLEADIWKLVGEEFNISSPKQLGEILFVKMGLKGKNMKKTAGGAMSTKESELEKLREVSPIIDPILKYRELQKLVGTYLDTIPTQVDKESRLHSHFLQIGAATGRMASKDPNLQNIPIKTELGRNIRHGFIAEEGFVLGAFDYSQIELRCAAILSDDEKLIEIFKSGEDVHEAVAAEVFNVEPKDVTAEMRRKAKVINFGILYGMGVNALRQNLGGTREEAQTFYNEYFKRFQGLAAYLDTVKMETERLGYTETLFGRRRYFEGIRSKLPFIKAAAERMAINAPIQGTQADLIKIAMKKIDEFLVKEKMEDKIHLLLQVHDELIYEMKKECVEKYTPLIKGIMQDAIDPKMTKGVPILANASVGPNWGEMQKVK